MKVLQINSFFTVGGPPRIMNGIYDTLKDNGCECKIAASREKMYIQEDSYLVCRPSVIRKNALKSRLLDNEGFNASKETENLIEIIKKYDPDIIQLHILHGYSVNIEILFNYLKKLNKPIVWTLHDCWPMTGHCTHFDFINCSKWKSETGCCECPQSREYPKSIFRDNSRENYIRKKEAFTGVPNMTIVTVSNWLKDIVKESFLKEYNIEVIPNGIDLKNFAPSSKTISFGTKKIVLGVAQNWNRKKGLDDMIHFSEYLSDEYQMVLVGLSKKQLKQLPNNIVGFEKTNSVEELCEIYSSAYVFLNFSVEETMGMTTVEALACGTPAIVYNRTAVPEVIDSICGWAVEPGDFKAVMERISCLGEKIGYISCCRNRAQEYEKTKQYKKYLDLYSRLLKG